MSDPYKFVYSFGAGKAEGKSDMKGLLGGKGANLAEMSVIGIPVPPRVHDHHRGLRGLLRGRAQAPRGAQISG